eukprot:340524-Hanusia_phi.AAC.3
MRLGDGLKAEGSTGSPPLRSSGHDLLRITASTGGWSGNFSVEWAGCAASSGKLEEMRRSRRKDRTWTHESNSWKILETNSLRHDRKFLLSHRSASAPMPGSPLIRHPPASSTQGPSSTSPYHLHPSLTPPTRSAGKGGQLV